jgi:signal transduction histidine kinase
MPFNCIIKMATNGYKPASVIAYMLLLLSVTGNFDYAYGQSHDEAKWRRIQKQYKSGILNDTAYLNRIDALVIPFNKDRQVKERLETYRKIAWSDDSYIPYRIKYFTWLAYDAALANQSGSSVYYLEKREEELKKIQPYVNSLSVDKQKYFIYGRTPASYIRSTKAYQKILPFLDSIPALIDHKNIPRNTCSNAIAILYAQASIFFYNKDSVSFAHLDALSERICNSVMRKQDRYAPVQELQFCTYLTHYLKQVMYNKPDEARNLLYELYNIVAAADAVDTNWKQGAILDIYRNLTNFFLQYRQNDSAAKYLTLSLDKQHEGYTDISDESYYMLSLSELKANEGAYKEAYENLLKAYNINDSLIAIETADINNNLYAQTAAENNAIELKNQEQETQKRYVLIGIAVLAACIIIVALLLRLHRKEQEIKRKIETLNKLTQIEIAELESKANLIQRKLAMELHDDVAGRLVYLCSYIDGKALDENDAGRARQLQFIGELAREAYQSTRNKSHEWYAEGQAEAFVSFSESIHKLVSYALPDGKYAKVISIDEESLKKVSHPIRIELLRIVQECVVNVLKHAEADKVMLFLYEEDNAMVLQIKDNGKGLGLQKNKPLEKTGLWSIRNRISDMKGSLEVCSTKEGTELMIVIPIG